MLNIKEVASKLNINESELELYGNYMAKVNTGIKDNNSKLILVTAITPTKHGEGKTTISIGLNDALCKIGKKSIVCLREPSLGPVFGMKGGACGGGLAKVIPDDKIDFHFTGDFHAITAANNLLASSIYNHIYWGNELNIDENKILFKRCLDVNDRSLRDNFNITAASEVMAIFCLAKDLEDLRNRLANIMVAYDKDNNPIYAKDLQVDGAMYLLLKDAFKPNLVQTLEGNPALVHGGPFANIAHGCSSINSIKLGLSLSDYVVTEAGFGSDLGCEKFIDITSRYGNINPNFIVLVATIRALEEVGYDNLQAHIDNLKQYNIPFCVCINHFSEDKVENIQKVVDYCHSNGIEAIISDAYINGGNGSIELANYVINNISDNKVSYLYELNQNVKEKFEILAKNVYHASNIIYSDIALEKLNEIDRLGFNDYVICVAKTQYSISDDKDKLGYPKDYDIHVKDIVINTGSKMIVYLLNNIITMPGLPKKPNFIDME